MLSTNYIPWNLRGLTSQQIMTIPRLSERVECMLYRRKLEVEVEEVRPELNIVRNASQELRASSRFRKVLQVGGPVLLHDHTVDRQL